MNEYLFDALMVLVMVLASIITRYLVPYFKTQIQNSEYAALLDIVSQAVLAAEQTMRDKGQGKSKKAHVVAFVSDWLEEHGIEITEDQLDRLIEAAVYTMNRDKV